MAQGVLPYKYEEDKTDAGLTALAGLPVYLDLASVLGLGDHIHSHMPLPAFSVGIVTVRGISRLR